MASRALVRRPLPSLSEILEKNTIYGLTKNAIMGLAMALNKYPNRTKTILFPLVSLSFPKYPLLMPAANCAPPSSSPISATVNPMDFKYIGMIGINSSLEISLNRLTRERTKMVRVMILDFGGIIALWVSFIQIIACLCDLYAPNSLRPLREIISRKERKVFRKERKENAKLSLLII